MFEDYLDTSYERMALERPKEKEWQHVTTRRRRISKIKVEQIEVSNSFQVLSGGTAEEKAEVRISASKTQRTQQCRE